MILIIAGHSPYVPHSVESFITMFHVPLFFFVSAYLFHYNEHFGAFIKRKISSLLVPLFFVVLITSLKELIEKGIDGGLKNAGIVLLGGIVQWNGTILDGQKWFMACLFISVLLFYFIIKVARNDISRIILITSLLTIIGLLYCRFCTLRLPWYIDVACASMYCWGIGYTIKVKNLDEKKSAFFHKYRFLLAISLFLIVVLLTYCNQGWVEKTVDVHNAIFGFEPLWVLGSVFGALLIIIISHEWLNNKLSVFIGENSIVFFLYAWTAQPVVKYVVGILKNYNIKWTPLFWVCEIIITLLICSVETIIINRFIPWLIGKKSRSQII